jgi:hypothetical protein
MAVWLGDYLCVPPYMTAEYLEESSLLLNDSPPSLPKWEETPPPHPNIPQILTFFVWIPTAYLSIFIICVPNLLVASFSLLIDILIKNC